MSFIDEISEEAWGVTRQLFRLAVVIFAVGVLLTIGCVMTNSSNGPIVFFCALLLSMLMTLFGVALTLFKVVQIRLPEMLLVGAVLGNAMGWIFSALQPRYEESSHKVMLGFAVALPCFVWTLGGAAWGLWVAKELLVENPKQRLWLVGVGLLTPPAFLFAVAAVPFFASAMNSLNPALCALYVLVFFLCLGELIYAMTIHTRVLKEIAQSGGDDD